MALDAVVALNRLGSLPMKDFYVSQLKDFEEQERDIFSKAAGWPSLSPRYSAWKALHYPGKPLLRASDRLYKSLTETTSDSIRKATDKGAQFGSRVPYANRHNRGTGGMPKREFLRFSLERITKALELWTMEQVTK